MAPTSAKFFLKEPKAKQPTLIYLIFKFGFAKIENDQKKYVHLKVSTGEKIDPKFWDFEKCRVKQSDKFPERVEINERLNQIQREVERIYRQILNDGGEPDILTLKSKLQERFSRKPQKVEETFFPFIDNWIKTVKYIKGPNNSPRQISERTRAKYIGTFNHLIDFKKYSNRKIEFDTINQDFYLEFLEYLEKEIKLGTDENGKPIIKQKLTPNTIGKHISILKTFLKVAKKKGYKVNDSFLGEDFASPKEKVEHIYLTVSELQKMFDLDLSENKKLEKVRDLFIVASYTGLRFSDFSRLTPDNIYKTDEGTFLKIRTEKTSETVVIPLHIFVRFILEKYKYQLPKAISNQKMNEYLKIIGADAGINDSVIISKTKGGERNIESKPKSKLISTHTGRRSAATNMFLAGMPSLKIMKITGHSTETAFLKYICIDNETNAIEMQKYDFWETGNVMKIAR
jgi:integrase